MRCPRKRHSPDALSIAATCPAPHPTLASPFLCLGSEGNPLPAHRTVFLAFPQLSRALLLNPHSDLCFVFTEVDSFYSFPQTGLIPLEFELLKSTSLVMERQPASQLETPTGPTLEKQPHGALHTSLQRTPPCAGELSRAGAGEHLPRSHSRDGNSGLLLPCPVAFQHISIACLPTRSSEKRNGGTLSSADQGALSPLQLSPGEPGGSGPILSLPSLACSWHPHLGTSRPPDHILYIHM